MRVCLVSPDGGLAFDARRRATEPLAAIESDLARDLDLPTIWAAMADGDPHVWEVARAATLAPATEPRTVRYRQEVLADLRAHPEAARQLYAIACDATRAGDRTHEMLRRTPSSTLRRSAEVLETLLGQLRRLRAFAEAYDGNVTSEGLCAFVATLLSELDEPYFAEMAAHLSRARFKEGVVMSAQLGTGNRGAGYVLRTARDAPGRRRRGEERGATHSYSFDVHPRDEAGREGLARLQDRGLNLAANVLAQSTDHVLAFFAELRLEAAYYLGCLNLERRLSSLSAPRCTPDPVGAGTAVLSVSDVYDPALVLRTGSPAVGNDVEADEKMLVVVTGAGSGGKSTCLRALGLAQLMMQCGMQVCATRFRGSLCEAIFSHFPREEDPSTESGRFDEELSRMGRIAEHLTPHAMVLFNESFAGTGEREGAELARVIVSALVGAGIRVLYVTHRYDFAKSLFEQTATSALFLRAERRDDGERTFKIREGAPLSTSYAPDLFERIGGFGSARSVGV